MNCSSLSLGIDKQINQGENLYNIAFGTKYQTVQIRKHPLTIIFLATSSASTGLILKESKELDTYFSQLQTNARTHLQIQN
ncbi:Oidioi.mRNA.OKI2018_I69.PAR.g11889.t1.cds [Oikopleura dioica]|uniref:Oidioi.mRNA.OKI2018_I69.PAR.g11889.t1.cds n=1 Tax=Oikopleura dioica TaxID=34765 RepID=A0ABN7RXX6_OIKDI|nr:Oidioi.mRNA.OKI2018_I69.PAR.g11889.t1.cds [Oikopleura dioica]